MRNIALGLKYDGTAYHGWQVQKTQVTVGETLEQVLEKLCHQPIHVTGCGRTDAGVHAACYCANFRAETSIPAEKLPLAVNSLLPRDISVQIACDAPEDFNSILSCREKEYTYIIHNASIPDPFLRHRAWFRPAKLDADVMQQAASGFVGRHDFAAVRSVGTETKTTVRTVHYFQVQRRGDLIYLRVCADGFLYNMVRAMVGTCVYASDGKLSPDDIPALLASGDRRLAGPTVPPQGLYMTRVKYDGPVGEMMRTFPDDPFSISYPEI